MASTINLLSYENGLYARDEAGLSILIDDYIGSTELGWVASNAVYSIQSTEFYTTNRYVINLNPSSSSTSSITLSNVPLKPEDRGLRISFNARVKAFSVITVDAFIYLDDNPTGLSSVSTSISSGEYGAVHSNVVTVPDDDNEHTITIVLSISGHGSNSCYITHLNLIHDLDFYDNPFVGYIRNYLPDFYWEIDSQQESPSFPFFKLIDALSSSAGDAKKIYDRLYGFESEQLVSTNQKTDYWARSVLTDPELASTYYGSWLAQFTGEALKKNLQLSNGNFYFENPGAIHEFATWQLSGSFFGRSAGSRRAIIEAVKQVLTKTLNGAQSTRSVAVTSRYQGNPFQILVQTLDNETIDANAGQSSYIVLVAANLAKPIGYLISHNTVTAFFFTIEDESLGVIGEFALS